MISQVFFFFHQFLIQHAAVMTHPDELSHADSGGCVCASSCFIQTGLLISESTCSQRRLFSIIDDVVFESFHLVVPASHI